MLTPVTIFQEQISLACMQTSPIPLLHAENGRLRNAVPNRVPVSHCSGFEFRINYKLSKERP